MEGEKMREDLVRPIINTECGNCGKTNKYNYESISDYGEAISPDCRTLFWSTKLLEFVKRVKK